MACVSIITQFHTENMLILNQTDSIILAHIADNPGIHRAELIRELQDKCVIHYQTIDSLRNRKLIALSFVRSDYKRKGNGLYVTQRGYEALFPHIGNNGVKPEDYICKPEEEG